MPQETASHWRFPVECHSFAPGAHRFTMQRLVGKRPSSGPESPESDPEHTLLLGMERGSREGSHCLGDSDVYQSPAAGSRGDRGTVIREEELYPSSGIYLSRDLT